MNLQTSDPSDLWPFQLFAKFTWNFRTCYLSDLCCFELVTHRTSDPSNNFVKFAWNFLTCDLSDLWPFWLVTLLTRDYSDLWPFGLVTFLITVLSSARRPRWLRSYYSTAAGFHRFVAAVIPNCPSPSTLTWKATSGMFSTATNRLMIVFEGWVENQMNFELLKSDTYRILLIALESHLLTWDNNINLSRHV